MANLHIHREHTLGLKGARKLAYSWAEQVEQEYDMECTYVEGDDSDELHFTRSGVKGVLLVEADSFELKAELGFLLGAFKDKIEQEIGGKLDAMLKEKAPAKGASRSRKA